ncbi:hypothetical protein CISG_02780 [Coccidioides immitis RMSCC 3703]|uniref:Uncharacterized protein n=1 Tax=Coccidioides immitis RMSCC 3703 TaxID=454286 RepID=A0A0J8U4G2_COCIT|nr:hypothetical protein CISG_02780 [Coccidioides immitis RMSCC 3703]
MLREKHPCLNVGGMRRDQYPTQQGIGNFWYSLETPVRNCPERIRWEAREPGEECGEEAMCESFTGARACFTPCIAFSLVLLNFVVEELWSLEYPGADLEVWGCFLKAESRDVDIAEDSKTAVSFSRWCVSVAMRDLFFFCSGKRIQMRQNAADGCWESFELVSVLWAE